MSELETNIREVTEEEAYALRDKLYDKFENLCGSVADVLETIQETQRTNCWQVCGYDSWQAFYEGEYEDHIQYIQTTKLAIDERIGFVQSLAEGGLSNRQIAATIGVNEKTVRNDIKASRGLGADFSAPNEVDAQEIAGQQVEGIGLIDDHAYTARPDIEPLPSTPQENEEPEEDDWRAVFRRNVQQPMMTAGQLFGNDLPRVESLPIPEQPEKLPYTEQHFYNDQKVYTGEIFVPRPRVSQPLEVINPKLGYHPIEKEEVMHNEEPDTSKVLEYPTYKLQMVEPLQNQEESSDEPHAKDSKHCKTCACNLLP